MGIGLYPPQPSYTILPHSEIANLLYHFEEARHCPDYWITCNYPKSEVEAVAKHFGIDISGIEIHCFPNMPMVALLKEHQRITAERRIISLTADCGRI
jgi:hypothetical protein